MADTVRIAEQTSVAIASILARRGVDAAAIGKALSLTAPTGPSCATHGALAVMGVGPGAWLAHETAAPADWLEQLQSRLTDLASVTDQGGAYRLFRIEGPGGRTLLQRGASIDLSDAAFPTATVALTVISHIDVIIRRLEETEVYELAVYRSYSESFLRWLNSALAAL